MTRPPGVPVWAVVRHLFDPERAPADSIGDTGASMAGARTQADPATGMGTRGGLTRQGDEVGGEVLICDGCLVLHRDGEIAYCSEELDGKTCAGYDMPHLAGV